MFSGMLVSALRRQKRKVLMIALTMALGISLATAMLNVVMDVESKISQELKTYGANLNVVPRGASMLGELYGIDSGAGVTDRFIAEDELGKMKTIFWANNIVDFVPYLEHEVGVGESGIPAVMVGTWFEKRLSLPTGDTIETGMRHMKAWWDVSGEWASESVPDGAMVGSVLAKRLRVSRGDRLRVASSDGRRDIWVKVRGTFSSGGPEDEQLFVPLQLVQEMTGLAGMVQRVEVSALTTPDNELSRRAAEDPGSLSRKEWDTWYCTAYISAIAYQIEEVLGNVKAKPLLQVSESEGAILGKVKLLMLLLTALSLACSALAISNLVCMNVMERNTEIGLMKAVGAANAAVSFLILAEVLVMSSIGGIFGYVAGLGLAQVVGHTVFGVSIALNVWVIPVIVLIVMVVSVFGSLPALRMLLSLEPTRVLHGR